MERSHGTAEAENFARLMRELKERAGLSYGVLARRLHTSTSTLHRYCNGEALPVEFAVVDRFARACGASAGEAVELHRAWLLADARRRAGAGAEATAGAEPVPVPTVVVAPAPESAGRGPWYRRRAVVLGAAGVTAAALAVTVAAVAAGGWGAAQAGSAPPAASASATPSSSVSGPSAPSPSGLVPVPPSASGAAPESGSAPAPGSPPVSGPASSAPAPVPVKAAVRAHVWAAGCDHAYLVERGPGAVPAPPVEADAPAWAAAQRAVHAGTQIVEVTVHGTGAGTGAVVLEDLEVRVAARRTPPAWNVYQMSQGCGGGLTPAAFSVNLDAPRPLVRPVAGNGTGGPVPAPAFPMKVSAAEPVVLRVEATTTGCDCDWSLDLRWTGPSGSGTLRIDDGGGRPLRTSAATGRPVYGYATEQGRWGR